VSFDFELAHDRGAPSVQPAWAPPSKPAAAPELASEPLGSIAPIELAPELSPPKRSLAARSTSLSAPIAARSGPVPARLTSSGPKLKLWRGVALILGGTLIGLIDRLYEAVTAQNLLPVPLVYLSGPLILVGVIVIIVGLLPTAG